MWQLDIDVAQVGTACTSIRVRYHTVSALQAYGSGEMCQRHVDHGDCRTIDRITR